jgi:hypothetical protein
MTARKRRGPNCPKYWKYTSLDTLALCVEGVTHAMSWELMEAMVPDDRNPEDGWGPSDYKADSPNRLEVAWPKLSIELKEELVPLLKAEDKRRGF